MGKRSIRVPVTERINPGKYPKVNTPQPPKQTRDYAKKPKELGIQPFNEGFGKGLGVLK